MKGALPIDVCGFRGVGTALAEQFVPLEALSLHTPAERLMGFGFEGAYVSENPQQLARDAAKRALEDASVAPGEIDVLLWASALGEAHHCRDGSAQRSVLDRFRYSASRLQEELDLDRASVCGIAQQGCAGMFSALRQARALLAAEPDLQHVLCVGTDCLPTPGSREILYNVISDAACAVVVSRQNPKLLWRGFHQISKGYYWDVAAKQSEIVAAYFPTSRAAILQVLRQTALRPEDIDLVIPTGVNASSWPILLRLCGIPEDRLFLQQQHFGHTIAADSFLILEEARAAGRLIPGQKVLLFAYGFGSSWSAMVLETTRFLSIP